MNKKKFTILSITALFAGNAFGQIANVPTLNTNDLSTGGKLAIGIGTPSAKLHILGVTNQLRLSYSSTIFSDINTSSAGNLVFTSNIGKICFGITAPKAGVGFHANMGNFYITDPSNTDRGLQVVPSRVVNGDVPAGTTIFSSITTPGEGLSLATGGTGADGVMLGAYAFCNNGWKSMWETANTKWTLPNLLLVKNGGNVGIGTATPRAKLDLIGNARIGADGAAETAIDPNTALTIYQNGGGKKALQFKTADNSLPIISIENTNFTGSPFTVYGDGKTTIGLTTITSGAHANAKLTVDGKIVSTSIYVTQSNWADFVFDENYKLPKLSDIENYYLIHKHLPNIPTAIQIEEDGNNLANTDALLLQKIEELTLYIVQQQKEIDTIKKHINK